MPYQRQYWNDYDESVSETINIERGAVVTPERMNNLESGVVNNHRELEIKKANRGWVEATFATIQTRFTSTYYTLSALRAEYPNGASGVFLILDINRLYEWSNGDWRDKGPYNPSIAEVKDFSVSRRKINFYQSNNIYYESDFHSGGYYDYESGVYVESYDFGYVKIYNFGSLTKYKILNLLTNDIRYITFWKGNVMVGGVRGNEFTTPANIDEIRISIRLLEKGQVAIIPSEDNKVIYTDPDLVIDAENISSNLKLSENNMQFIDIEQSDINKFNPNDIRDNGYYHYQTGQWISSSNYFTSNLILVSAGDILRSNSKGSNTLYTNFWKADGTWLSGINQTTDVVVPAGARYATLTFNKSDGDTPDNVIVTRNNSMPIEYVPWYQHRLNKKILLPVTSKYSGAKLSVIGDSFSSYAGYIPSGNRVYYTGSNAGVTNVSEMWWRRVCDRLGMSPLVINAWSGSKVSTIDADVDNFVAMSDVSRAQGLHQGATDPDVIINFAGTNDFSKINANINTFDTAYRLMISRMQQRYKSAKIICLSLPIFVRTNTDKSGIEINDEGKTVFDYNEVIRKAANEYSCQYIDLNGCGITRQNLYPRFAVDYETIPTHPNSEGHKMYADKIIASM